MITKRNLILLLLAILSVGCAIYALYQSKKINQEIQNPAFFLPNQQTSSQETVEFIQSDFDGLLSGADMESLYEGEEGSFTTTGLTNE